MAAVERFEAASQSLADLQSLALKLGHPELGRLAETIRRQTIEGAEALGDYLGIAVEVEP